MTPRQRQAFINGLIQNKVDYKEIHGGEISMLCPKCAHLHDNKRRTLSINSNNDRWQCWRCPTLKGRKNQIGLLLATLNLQRLLPVFEEDEILVEEDSLAKIRHRLLGVGATSISTEVSPFVLPLEYRTDWRKSDTGETLLKYLMVERKLSLETIAKNRIGYAAKGKYAGCVILPVYMNKKLVFWQVRRVMMIGNAPKYDSPKISRRHVLFGYDTISTKSCNLVEGIFDALAVGDGTVGLLSKSISEEQIGLLGEKGIETARVVLDGEAWEECKQIAYILVKKLWTVKLVIALRLPFGKDPGNLGRAAIENPVEVLRLKP